MRCGAAGEPASGSMTRNVAPPPGVSTTSTIPLCAATIDETMASPRPDPPVSRVRDVSARQNLWKIYSRIWGGMPSP